MTIVSNACVRAEPLTASESLRCILLSPMRSRSGSGLSRGVSICTGLEMPFSSRVSAFTSGQGRCHHHAPEASRPNRGAEGQAYQNRWISGLSPAALFGAPIALEVPGHLSPSGWPRGACLSVYRLPLKITREWLFAVLRREIAQPIAAQLHI